MTTVYGESCGVELKLTDDMREMDVSVIEDYLKKQTHVKEHGWLKTLENRER